MLAWLNGNFIEESKVGLGLKTHGLHYSTSVFEGVRAYNGHIFAAKAHAERLIYSANMTRMPLPYDASTLVSVMEELIARVGLENAYLRPIVWKGDESLGVYSPKNSINVAVIIFEWPNVFDAEAKQNGISLTKNVPYRRPDPASAPVHAKAAANYLIGVINRETAEQQGYNDCLIADYKGYVAEASGANIFFEKNGELFTPVAESFLNGITRQVTMALAKENKIPVHEMHIPFEDLDSFDNVFLTGTAYEIIPVRKIDSLDYKIGGKTLFLQKQYEDLRNIRSVITCKDGYAEIARNMVIGA